MNAIHPAAWSGWLGAAAVALLVTRNPLYLLLILVCEVGVALALRPQSQAPPLPLSPLRFGLLIIAASALFNVATAHFGATVLLRLPPALPLIGGAITLEALVFGITNGLALCGFLGAFTVLNLALPAHALVRLIPRALYPVAVIISIAVAFTPTTLSQFQQIREAQLVRGHRVRGLRDWLPLLMPLLISGLERALQLAEAMTARGFASREDDHETRALLAVRAGLVLGLAAVLAGLLVRMVWRQRAVSWGLIIAGAGLALAALWLAGRHGRRSVYRLQPWTRRDNVVLLGAAIVLAAYLLPLPGLDRLSLFYYPYPQLSLPPIDLGVSVATLGLLAPAWLLARSWNAVF